MSKNKFKIVEYLKQLSKLEITPYKIDMGLCGNIHYLCELDYITDEVCDELIEIIRNPTDWEHWSGERTYPISHPNTDPSIAYSLFSYNQWQQDRYESKYDKEYIKRRLDLCRYVAEVYDERH